MINDINEEQLKWLPTLTSNVREKTEHVELLTTFDSMLSVKDWAQAWSSALKSCKTTADLVATLRKQLPTTPEDTTSERAQAAAALAFLRQQQQRPSIETESKDASNASGQTDWEKLHSVLLYRFEAK